MDYGTRELKIGDKGEDVEELQIRLAGFNGGVPDGDFGPGSEKMVGQFQEDYMGIAPHGVVDVDTFFAIDKFADEYPLNFEALKCPCSTDPQFKNWEGQTCDGFGNELCEGEYRDGKPKIEAYYKYEYPGIHRMILWATRATFFYHPEYTFTINCGYRCWVRNKQKGRSSTNHMGKAIDIDVPRTESEDRNDDLNRCNEIREEMVKDSNAQIGWNGSNKKSLEPSNIAPTWVHYDVRQFAKKFLENRFFCKSEEELNNRLPITIKQEEENGSNDETKIIEEPTKNEIEEPVKSSNWVSSILDLVNLILGLFTKKKK